MGFESVIAPAAMIAILVFIHEFGHFVVAKLCGVAVPVFSFGFGRRLFGFQFRGTDYRLSLLPFGGYVRIAGADPFGYGDEDDDEIGDRQMAFSRRPVWQRLAILGAGPLFNLLLPIGVFTLLLMAGEPIPAAEVGEVEATGIAASAGLQAGDRIIAFDDQPVESILQLDEALDGALVGRHTITVRHGDRTPVLQLQFDSVPMGVGDLGFTTSRPDNRVGVDSPSSPAGLAGLRTGDEILAIDGVEVRDWIAIEAAFPVGRATVDLDVRSFADEAEEPGSHQIHLVADPDFQPPAGEAQGPLDRWGLSPLTLFVGKVSQTAPTEDGILSEVGETGEESAAHKAGVLPGDRLLMVDGIPVRSWDDVLKGVSASMEGEGESAAARAVAITLVREGGRIDLDLVPTVIRDTNRFGRYYFRPILGITRQGSYADGPMVKARYGPGAALVRATQTTVALSGAIIEQIGMVVTGEAAFRQSVGGPVEMFRQAREAAKRGIFDWARLLGMLSISLGIVNLLPVPVLDGGQIIFTFVEGIRGRALPRELRERVQQVGVLFLVLLMLTVLVSDLHRLFQS